MMKMCEVRVGMLFRDTAGYLLTVTALTERGFTYSYETGHPLIPRWGWSIAKDGHEHFGHDGHCLYDLVGEETSSA